MISASTSFPGTCCSAALCALLTATGLLLPMGGAAESQLGTGKSNARVSASAHVDFRIVIPQTLSLDVANGDTQRAGTQSVAPVAIYSNSRNVTLAASTGSAPAARNNVVLRATAGKVIERGAACRFPDDARGAAETNRMICTVAMP
ncbi:MAG: hypothetical protein M3N97_11770 [Pseudomonadota bacterium]|nr:hypothetical protein [Pseudomonadota bacterium]